MAQRLSLSMMMLAWSVAPAMAGTGGGSDTAAGSFIITAVGHLVQKLVNLF